MVAWATVSAPLRSMSRRYGELFELCLARCHQELLGVRERVRECLAVDRVDAHCDRVVAEAGGIEKVVVVLARGGLEHGAVRGPFEGDDRQCMVQDLHCRPPW